MQAGIFFGTEKTGLKINITDNNISPKVGVTHILFLYYAGRYFFGTEKNSPENKYLPAIVC